MPDQSTIPYWKQVVDQKTYRNNLTCSDLDALAAMLPRALLELKFDEVEPEAFSLPEEYTTEDIEEAVNKVVRHLDLHKRVHKRRPSPGMTHHPPKTPPQVERRVRVTFKRFTPEEKDKDKVVAYIFDRKREFIDIYFDLDRIEKREFAPSSVMEVVIHEVCHEMLWTYGYVETKGYRNISRAQVTEYLTEMCVVYTGFGKIMSNSSLHAEQRGLGDPGYIDWWQVSYLRQKFFGASVPVRHTRFGRSLFYLLYAGVCTLFVKLWHACVAMRYRFVYAAFLFVFALIVHVVNIYVLPPEMETIKTVLGVVWFVALLLLFLPWKLKDIMFMGLMLLLSGSGIYLFGTKSNPASGVLHGTPWYTPMAIVYIIQIFFAYYLSARNERKP